jgi:hypothetical protein
MAHGIHIALSPLQKCCGIESAVDAAAFAERDMYIKACHNRCKYTKLCSLFS